MVMDFVLLQMSGLISENRILMTRLESGARLLQARSSSVEEEVLAVEQVRYVMTISGIETGSHNDGLINFSQGRLCRKCLAMTETPNTSDLCLILQHAVTNWISEVSPVLKRWLQTLIHR